MSTETQEHVMSKPALAPRISRKNCENPKSNPYYLLGIFEKGVGKRLCIRCGLMLPTEEFAPGQRQNTQHFVCKKHPEECQKIEEKPENGKRRRGEAKDESPLELAAVSLRKRAKNDLETFKQSVLDLSMSQTRELLRREHINDYCHFSIVPLRPQEPVSPDNAAVVSVSHRRYITGLWRQTHDPVVYARDLKTLMEHHDAPRPRI
jgi:hypothetical protein